MSTLSHKHPFAVETEERFTAPLRGDREPEGYGRQDVKRQEVGVLRGWEGGNSGRLRRQAGEKCKVLTFFIYAYTGLSK